MSGASEGLGDGVTNESGCTKTKNKRIVSSDLDRQTVPIHPMTSTFMLVSRGWMRVGDENKNEYAGD